MNDILYIAIMVFCVVMSGYFSATETAFSCFNKTKMRTIAEKGDKRAKLVLNLSEKYDKLISTILIGNNIVNIAVASIGTVLFVAKLGDIGATVSTVVITIVVLIFGEITPKNIAKDVPEKFAMFSAPFISLLIYVFLPLNAIFSLWKKLISKVFGLKNDTKMSQEELLMLVDEVSQDGSIAAEEGDLLKNVIEFTDRRASEILTHRTAVEAVDINGGKEAIAKVFNTTRYSRLPVYQESIDNVIGVVHQKDFYVGSGVYAGALEDILTPPLFIHDSAKVSEIFKLLNAEKSHIAIVVDEYGGTAGLITMEDILEEIVGEIWDEHDEVHEEVTQLEDLRYEVDCSVTYEDFCKRFEVNEEYTGTSKSLGGRIMEALERIPKVGDEATIANVRLTVTEVDGKRASKATVEVIPPKEEEVEEQ